MLRLSLCFDEGMFEYDQDGILAVQQCVMMEPERVIIGENRHRLFGQSMAETPESSS